MAVNPKHRLLDFAGLGIIVDQVILNSGGVLTELDVGALDGITPGTVLASSAVIVDANKDIGTFRHLTLSGNLVTGSTTLSAAELGVLDSAAAANSGTGKALITGTSGALTIAGAAIASSTLAVTGVLTPTGGVAAAGGGTVRASHFHTGGIPARLNSDGTDTTPVNTEVYINGVTLQSNTTVTGVSIFNGSAVAGNMKVGLANSAGVVVATSASTAQAGIDAYQRVPFTAPLAAIGPQTYYVLLMFDTNTTPRFNTHIFGDFSCSKQTGQVYATGFTTITPPTTFTTGQGPIASLY